MSSLLNWTEVQDFIVQHLKPIVSTIDQDDFYPRDFIKQLGEKGLYSVAGKTPGELAAHYLRLIEEAGKVCGTTSFTVWCHLASILYARNSRSTYIKGEILPRLECGEIIGGTGLSNPMKYYAGMEDLRLAARREGNGYLVSGTLPFVSNLGLNHWFGIIAQVSTEQRVAALIPCHSPGLEISEIKGFLALNGSATYQCTFRDVWIPKEYILSEHADEWILTISPQFVLFQIGMALGIIRSALDQINKLKGKQRGVNRFIQPHLEKLEQRWKLAHDLAYRLASNPLDSEDYLQEILRVRLEGSYLALDVTNAAILHSGAAGYVAQSHASRRLREAYFVALVTPAIKHLEKLLKVGRTESD